MDYNKINKCIKNAIRRVQPERHKMSTYTYINYFCNRNNLTIEESLYVRKSIEKYMKKNKEQLFPCEFTINGLAV